MVTLFKNSLFGSLVREGGGDAGIGAGVGAGAGAGVGITFKPEDDEGYIEYKLRLDHVDRWKVDKMITQMRYRLNEGKMMTGKYVAYYLIGVDDDGSTGYITRDILDKSLDVIREIVPRCNAEIFSIETVAVDESRVPLPGPVPDSAGSTGPERYISLVSIRNRSHGKYIDEYRVVMLGASGAGKTTCVSYLTYSERDNGHGLSRRAIFKHAHEQSTGLTSSIKHDIFGLREGNIFNYRSRSVVTWDKIVEYSDRIISLFDLPGSSKYHRTINFGVMALRPNLHLIVVGLSDCVRDSEVELPEETVWAVSMSLSLGVPIFILLTKKDLVAETVVGRVVARLAEVVGPYGKTLGPDGAPDVIPYLSVSNVTGENYERLITFLDGVSGARACDVRARWGPGSGPGSGPGAGSGSGSGSGPGTKIDFMIYDVNNIKEKGYIVSGISLEGEIRPELRVFIGPVDGEFHPIIIKSIHKKQTDSNVLFPGEAGSIEFHLEGTDVEIDKHTSIVDEKTISLLTHTVRLRGSAIPTLSVGHQYMLYVDNLIEPVILSGIPEPETETGIFTFVRRSPMYVRHGSRCILRGDAKLDVCIFATVVGG